MDHRYSNWPKGLITQKLRLRTPAKIQGEQTTTTSTDYGGEKRTASSYRRCSLSSLRLEAMWYFLLFVPLLHLMTQKVYDINLAKSLFCANIVLDCL